MNKPPSAPGFSRPAFAAAARPELEYVDAVLADFCGTLRGKRLRIEEAGKLFESGMQIPLSIQLMDAHGEMANPFGRGYGAGAAGPHAVSSITGTVNGVTNPTFTYDANGNMTGSAGRSVTYTAFNMAAQITQGTTTVAFSYDSGHARIKQVIGGGSPSTTYYLNALGAHSEKFVAGATTTWHDYIYAAGQLVAEHFNTGGTITMRYAVSDHLGSVSSVADASAAVTERLSYDAWGKRRNANGTDNTACSITSAISRGYTGHEMMDAVCLINANARIYDPTLGRFMSADSIVPNAFDGQSFNRYSYVNNNPLAFTDPSGHVECLACWGPGTIKKTQDGYSSVGDGGYVTSSEIYGDMGGGDFGPIVYITYHRGPHEAGYPAGGGVSSSAGGGDPGGGGGAAGGHGHGKQGDKGKNGDKHTCDAAPLHRFYQLYNTGKSIGEIGSAGLAGSALASRIPGAQGVAAWGAAGSAATVAFGYGMQADSGYEILQMTGDSSYLKSSAPNSGDTILN